LLDSIENISISRGLENVQGSERNFVIWWNCGINVRVVGARYFEGVLFGVKSANKSSRCYYIVKADGTRGFHRL